MPEAIVNQFFIRNFVTTKQSEDDTGPEIILDGQGLFFCNSNTYVHTSVHYFKKLIEMYQHLLSAYIYRFSSLKPNITHEILKHSEYVGKVGCIITQNVDNLHLKAGSKKVIELHGTAFRVMCLNCNHKISRYELQRIFQKLNPSMIATTQMIRPDGDVELSQVYTIVIFVYMYIYTCNGCVQQKK